MNRQGEIVTRPMSVILARDCDVLQQMLSFYAAPGGAIIDVTANQRRMWKGVRWNGPITFADIDIEVNPDIVADFRNLPCEGPQYDLVVFDPPHLPAAAASKNSLQRFAEDYGLRHAPKADNISEYFAPFLKEAYRVLRDEGLIFAKLKDYVHNHKYQWVLTDFIAAVREQPGLTACDLIIKRDPSAGSLKSSKWKNAHHVRNCHAWWVVVRKGRCEPKINRRATS